jgi:molybdopterin-guanine dinucleotide biosynthesis protein A
MTLTAVLFVGGLSRRMGADKALIEIAGQPLWARQINLLREFQPQSLWVSARTRPAWCPAEIELVLDASPSHGPLSGLVAALDRLQTSHLLALAIDLPRMTVAELRKLWAMARPGLGVIPVNGKNFEPLCAIYPAEGTAPAASALAGNNFSLQKLLQSLLRANCIRTHALTEDEKPLFLNANSPADLQSLPPLIS